MTFDRLRKMFGGIVVPKEPHVEPPSMESLHPETRKLLKELLDEVARIGSSHFYMGRRKVEEVQNLLEVKDRLPLAMVCVRWLARINEIYLAGPARSSLHRGATDGDALDILLTELLRKDILSTDAQAVSLLQVVTETHWPDARQFPWGSLLHVVERQIKRTGLSPELAKQLRLLHDILAEGTEYINNPKLAVRMDQMLGKSTDDQRAGGIERGDAWINVLFDTLDAMDEASAREWHQLLSHCNSASASAPSARWLKKSSNLISKIGSTNFVDVLMVVLEQIGRPGTGQVQEETSTPLFATLLDDRYTNMLRGLVWCGAVVKDRRSIAALGAAADACFKKIPGIGPRNAKVGNACLTALSLCENMDAAAQLSRLNTKVRHASVRRQVGKALSAAADRAGVTIEELEDMSTPDFGMSEVGVLRQQIGDFEAQVRIVGGTIDLQWLDNRNKARLSVPTVVRAKHAAELKDLKRQIKDMQQILLAQRTRIDHAFIEQRQWRYPDWRRRYLDHPLLGSLTRRLIWFFESGRHRLTCAFLNGNIVGSDDQPVAGFDERTRVSLWHPIGFEAQHVLAWRGWLDRHQVTQPFKQAHREIYILTDAELQTATYSNRFAGHILRQHQLNELCRQRGWVYRLQGGFDSFNAPTLALPQWNLHAEFHVEGGGAGDQGMTQSGIFTHVATDHVRFLRGGQYLPLVEVPAMAFTEVMRDVDLFVAVCSVGNDPNWRDRGDRAAFGDYWHDFTFGVLSATAQTRREVLERLLPRLRIAAQCSLVGRFLVVRGKLRTYKIHLGSSNILMEPNDQYLCIVPGHAVRGIADGPSLPFEGDSTLSVILSKAMMLANDVKIDDPSIVRQITQ